MADGPVQPGDMLAGKYRVEKVLGRGAMGVVCAALQVKLNRRVALKFITKEGQHEREYVERFEREALAAAQLQNQHTAKVLDFGTLDTGAPYIVMEFLDGKDVSATIKERGPFDVEEAVTLILQACEGLAEAHALGIVHRDIKPANLFLARTPDGSVCLKVVDFGVAKVQDGDLSLTGTAMVLGSPVYMAPEAFNGAKELDARADVWALGVTLYEMLSGVTPFQRENINLLMAAICMQPPAPLQQYRPDVPTGLCVVIEHALEKMRDKRFDTVSAFAAALAPYAPGRAAPYVERMAKVQRTNVVPARPTDLLPPEPGAGPLPSSPAVVTSVPAATQREPETTSIEATAPRARSGASIPVTIGLVLIVSGLSVAIALAVTKDSREPTSKTTPISAPSVSGTVLVADHLFPLPVEDKPIVIAPGGTSTASTSPPSASAMPTSVAATRSKSGTRSSPVPAVPMQPFPAAQAEPPGGSRR